MGGYYWQIDGPEQVEVGSDLSMTWYWDIWVSLGSLHSGLFLFFSFLFFLFSFFFFLIFYFLFPFSFSFFFFLFRYEQDGTPTTIGVKL